MKLSVFSIVAILSAGISVGMTAFAKEKKEGPCREIVEACKNAGFKPGDWKAGDGLWRDCVDPIVQGASSVPGSTKSLPAVDSKVIAECKSKHPRFGGGKVGSVPHQKKSAS